MACAAVTLRQCAILAGGLGTRLGSVTAHTPKPLLDIGGRPFLAWLMRELQRFGVEEFVILAGHLSERVQAGVQAIAERLPRPARLCFSVEPQRAGTGGALFHARRMLEQRFLLVNGDSVFATNLAPHLAAFADDAPAVAARMLLRAVPDAGRYGVVALQAGRVSALQEKRGGAGPGLINSGIYLLDRSALDLASAACSLERDILPVLAARGAVRGAQGEGYFIDIGIPEDLARARAELPARLARPALFLDRDGVLNVEHGYVGSRERWDWMPGALALLRHASDAGVHVFVVTNQSGIARGLYTEADFTALMQWVADTARRAGGTIDDWRHCPYHEDGSVPQYRRASDWRKPAPGMLLDLLRAWDLDPAACLLIGDQPSDLVAAAAAGMAGHHFAGPDLDLFAAPLLRGLAATPAANSEAPS